MLAGKSLNLPVFVEDDLTSMKLKKLLQEQTKKNEFLNEKNIRLGIQQKSLLALLQKKDLAIRELGMVASGKKAAKDQGVKGITLFCVAIERKLARNGFERVKNYAGSKEEFEWKIKSLINCFESTHNKQLKKHFTILKSRTRLYKATKKLFVICKKLCIGIGFNSIHQFILEADKILAKKNKSLLALIRVISDFNINASLKTNFFVFWKNYKKNYVVLINALTKLQKNRKLKTWQKLKIHVLSSTISQLHQETKTSENKCKSFSKTFLALNTLCLIHKSQASLNLKKSFKKWSQKNTVKNITSLVIRLKKLLKSRFPIKSPNTLTKLSPIFSLFLSSEHLAFISIFNYSFNLSQEMLEFEAKTLSTQVSSLNTSSCSAKSRIAELSQESLQLKQHLAQLTSLKSSKHSSLSQKNSQCHSLESSLNKHLEDIKKFQQQAEEKVQNEGENCEQFMKEITKNNQIIEKIEKNIDFYCEDIGKIENEGRLAALQLTQLEASLKKAQELHNSALSEKARIALAESEAKKQKISLTGKIDALAEEKERYLNRIQELQNEKKSLISEIQEKKQKLMQVEEVVSEYETKAGILSDKKRRMAENLDDDFDVKDNLIMHKEKELQKVKETLNHSKAHIESLLKDLNSKIKSEEKERINKISSEFNLITYKNEEVLRDIGIESQKIVSLSSNMQSISFEKEKMQDELRNLQENLNRSSVLNQNLKEQLLIVTNSAKNPVIEDFSGHLREYSLTLEGKIKELTEELARNQSGGKRNSVKAAHEARIKDLELKLKECQEGAIRSRVEVAEAISEIEHYAHILSVMEEKMNETEEKVLICLREKECAAEELRSIRDDYFGFIAKG